MKQKTDTYNMIRAILLCLSNVINSRKNQIYNITDIAEVTKLDRTAISRHLKELEDLRIIDCYYVGNKKYYTIDNHHKKKFEDECNTSYTKK